MALASFFICWSRRDWFWLTIALACTLGADYFLILHDRHLPGVAVFCFAHVAYILRAVTSKPGFNRRFISKVPILITGLVAIAMALFWLDTIYVVTAIYGALFIANIIISARYLPRNRGLAITGLLLFAACDICVLIFNMPAYLGAPIWLRDIYPMIWVFYLPSQALLSISAVSFTKPWVRQRPIR